MPSYFSLSQFTSDCVCPDDTDFLLEIVDDFKQLLVNFPAGLYPATITLALKFDSKADVTETIQLSLEGSVMYIYMRMFKEPYPSMPFTELQRQRINAIWEGIGHPENIIPS